MKWRGLGTGEGGGGGKRTILPVLVVLLLMGCGPWLHCLDGCVLEKCVKTHSFCDARDAAKLGYR